MRPTAGIPPLFAMEMAHLRGGKVNATLFSAAAKACVALARRLLGAGASLQARDHRSAMPLTHAARGGNVALVEMSFAASAPIDARDLSGATDSSDGRRAALKLLFGVRVAPVLPHLRMLPR